MKSNSLSPVRIEHVGIVVRVSCGGEHTAIIDELGNLSTFGFGFNGQLGHDDCHDVSTPTPVRSFEQTRVVHVARHGRRAFSAALSEVRAVPVALEVSRGVASAADGSAEARRVARHRDRPGLASLRPGS